MELRPVELGLLRSETVEYLNERGIDDFGSFIAGGMQRTGPFGRSREAAVLLAADELARVRDGDLFYVTAPMVELALQAAKSLPAFSVAPEDLPSPKGFIYFDKPIVETGAKVGHRVSIVAAAWGPSPSWFDHGPHGGIQITWYNDVSAAIRSVAPELLEHRSVPFRLGMCTETAIQFNTEMPEVDETGSTYEGELIMKAVWLLMAQPLAAVTEAHYDRAAARRFTRNQTKPPQVRVITLRRPVGTHGDTPGDREYHHQWIVRGHWRQQWYPARQVHRPVWIAPHIKGPEGLPLLGGEKVYALRR